jgi:uncharacterized protein (DUF1330 family)
MPKAYWVAAYREIYDAEMLAAYLELATPAIKAAGGKFIARGPAAKIYEQGLLQRTTIIEFDSLQTAIDMHDGPQYQAALQKLGNGVNRDLRLVEGVDE